METTIEPDIVGKRIWLKDAYGTIRFLGKLTNNGKDMS